MIWFLTALVGCNDAPRITETGEAEPPPWADVVLDADSDAALAANGARGLGDHQGGTDVYSLGLDINQSLILSWSAGVLNDGPGVDLVVFENAFVYANDEVFVDPVVVGVSPDGVNFVDFPHTFAGPDPEVWSSDPNHWIGFAGKTPVRLNEDTNPTDPFDPSLAGGDGFDFADLPDGDPVADDIRASGAVAVRLTWVA